MSTAASTAADSAAAPQVELAAGGERVGEFRRRTVHGGPLVVIGGTSYHGDGDRRPAGGPRRVSER